MRSGGAFAMACNVFKFCTALRALGSIMILLVLSIVVVSYYAVVVAHYGPALVAGGHGSLLALAILVPFHVLLGLLLWTYFSVVFTDPGEVPPNWKPILDEEIGETTLLTGMEQPGLTDSETPAIRYCRKCNRLKPPRCHHCSICGRCVLKMDHHCVWVVNCVGALNYKFFLLFLVSIFLFLLPLWSVICYSSRTIADFYTFLETSLVTLSLFPHFLAFFQDVEIPGSPAALATTFLTFVLNLAFALSVMGFLIMHISLVMKNTTTIEAYEKKTTPKWKYDLCPKKNFEQVFGTDKKFWFIPAYSHEDRRRIPALQGLEYPTKPDLDVQ